MAPYKYCRCYQWSHINTFSNFWTKHFSSSAFFIWHLGINWPIPSSLSSNCHHHHHLKSSQQYGPCSSGSCSVFWYSANALIMYDPLSATVKMMLFVVSTKVWMNIHDVTGMASDRESNKVTCDEVSRTCISNVALFQATPTTISCGARCRLSDKLLTNVKQESESESESSFN